jgi:hypothetical protein
MLAAVSKEQARTLDLFQAVLAFVTLGRSAEIPERVRNHFDAVVGQAKALVADPFSVTGTVMPEAIELALELRQWPDLSSVINNVVSVDTLNPDKARLILNTLEQHVAASD